MRVLFAAPEDAWDGFLGHLREHCPEFEFEAAGTYQTESLAGYDVLLPTMTKVTAQLLATGDRLRLIQQVGAGLEGVDMDAARRLGIPVTNVPTGDSGNADSVAELGIYMMIGLSRHYRALAHNLSRQRLGAPFGQALKGKTVGIVGLGGIGQALIERLRPFGVEIIGLKRREPKEARQRLGLAWAGTLADLPELLGRSDYVILAAPDTAETHHLLNRHSFPHMKPTAYLINLGRGGLIERDSLEYALASGQIAGAGLDVFWTEPPDPQDPIFRYNVLATPHVAGSTDITAQGIQAVVGENLRRLSRGEPLLHVQGAQP